MLPIDPWKTKNGGQLILEEEHGRHTLMKRRHLALLLAVLAAPAAARPASAGWSWSTTDIAVGRAELGPWRMNESRWDYVDDPSVALDARGEAAVVWVDQARKDVYFQRVGTAGEKLGAPVNVSRTAAVFSWLPRIVLSPDDPARVFVLWQEIVFSGGSHGGEIFFSRSQDGGASFSAPLNLSRSQAGDGKGQIDRHRWHNGSLDLAAAGNTVYAAWTEYEGALWFSRSTDGGARFSAPLRVAGGEDRPARAPSLALGADGSVYLAWTVGRDRLADIRVARSADGGASFAPARIVAPSPEYSDAPKLAVDANGVVHLVYAESSRGPFDPARILYTRSTDAGTSFAVPREISPLGAGFPSLSVDAQGHLYVLWELVTDPRGLARGLALAVSRDGGASFAPAGTVPTSIDPAGGWNGSRQGLLMRKLAVNGAGAVAIVNSSFRPDERSRVWLIRGVP